MIRFANPGSNVDGFIRIFMELYSALSPQGTFNLDDMSRTLVNRNLATSSGYMGAEALARSTRPDRSRDPLYNQSKMYSELYKLLGWLHPIPDSALQFRFTLLGAHVPAATRDHKALLIESILGIVFPNPILGTKGNYTLRPFPTILRAADDLGGLICRDEIIAGPLSLENDREADLFSEMVNDLRTVRGEWRALCARLDTISRDTGINLNTMGNYTRFPIAILKWSEWFSIERNREEYGRPIPFLRLTSKGASLLRSVNAKTDIRYGDLQGLDDKLVGAIARLGFHQMLARAGFDVDPVREQLEQDSRRVGEWLDSPHPEILFSPFQDLPPQLCDEILPLVQGAQTVPSGPLAGAVISQPRAPALAITRVGLYSSARRRDEQERDGLVDLLTQARREAGSPDAAAQIVAEKYAASMLREFYPFVAEVFRLLGYDCEHSRAGVNYQRWDAFIQDSERSIPIEIKSPTEEEYLSPKSIRQALENKVVLISRGQFPTTRETTSLAVGYRLPNDRSDVNLLVQDIYTAFQIRIGVIDIVSLLKIAVAEVTEGKDHDREALMHLFGIVDVQDIMPAAT